jgi:hypothetical protein
MITALKMRIFDDDLILFWYHSKRLRERKAWEALEIRADTSASRLQSSARTLPR